jgi:hypothetical protein
MAGSLPAVVPADGPAGQHHGRLENEAVRRFCRDWPAGQGWLERSKSLIALNSFIRVISLFVFHKLK